MARRLLSPVFLHGTKQEHSHRVLPQKVWAYLEAAGVAGVDVDKDLLALAHPVLG